MPRFPLIAGPYRPPRTRRGDVLMCLVRDTDCIVLGMTAARIQWPRGRAVGVRAAGVIVTDELARAIATESNQAVAYWFGISPTTVSVWRRALDVPRATPGTSALWRKNMTPAKQSRARKAAYTPQAIAKRAAKRRGMPLTPETRAKISAGRQGITMSAASRAKLSQTNRRIGRRVPGYVDWTAAEDAIVRRYPPAEASRRTGRTLQAVYVRRHRLHA